LKNPISDVIRDVLFVDISVALAQLKKVADIFLEASKLMTIYLMETL
jgi:hypothetical protein